MLKENNLIFLPRNIYSEKVSFQDETAISLPSYILSHLHITVQFGITTSQTIIFAKSHSHASMRAEIHTCMGTCRLL